MDDNQNIQSHHNHWNVGGLFWGLLLILVGGLVIASNLDYVELQWGAVWRLWPLMIVAAGASILAVKHVVWKLFSVILVFLSLGLIAWVLLGGMPANLGSIKQTDFSVSKSSASIESASIKILGGAGELDIHGSSQTEIIKSKLESNVSTIGYMSNVNGAADSVTLTMDTKKNNDWFKLGTVKNDWAMSLNRDLPLTLDVNAGATSANIDLSDTHTKNLTINMGASSLDLKLGSLEKELGVELKSGVSSINIKVPKSSGVAVDIDSGLASNDLADLTKISDGLYESSNYKTALNKINITAKTGVSSLNLVRY